MKFFKLVLVVMLCLYGLACFSNESIALSDKELVEKMQEGIAANSFYGKPEALAAVSQLIDRNNIKVKDKTVIDCLVGTAAALLDTTADWTDRDQAKVIYDLIKKYDNNMITASLVRKVKSDDGSRLKVLFLSVKLGIPGSEKQLNAVLSDHGDKQMAEDFLNSGSQELYDGGKSWANGHGYAINTGMGSHRTSWGSF